RQRRKRHTVELGSTARRVTVPDFDTHIAADAAAVGLHVLGEGDVKFFSSAETANVLVDVAASVQERPLYAIRRISVLDRESPGALCDDPTVTGVAHHRFPG